MKRTLYFASPGTGKTTTLIKKVSELVASGVQPKTIGFTSFTRSAAKEAVDRVQKMFTDRPNLKKDFYWFRTLHSICYTALGFPKMVSNEDLRELYRRTGIKCLSSETEEPIGPLFNANGDVFLNIYNTARQMRKPLKEAWSLMASGAKDELYTTFNLFIAEYENLKNFYKLQDYSDLLVNFISFQGSLGLEYLFVDEAQDLTPLQWECIFAIERSCKESFIAGDDKQCIYEWAGATPKTLIELEGNRVKLDVSYRLPKSVLNTSRKIYERISLKVPVSLKTAVQDIGSVSHIGVLDGLDVTQGSWLFLARLKKGLGKYEDFLYQRGQIFSDEKNTVSRSYLEAIRTWEDIRKNILINGASLKNLMKYLSCGSGYKKGAKQWSEAQKEDQYFSQEELQKVCAFKLQDAWYDHLYHSNKAYYKALWDRGLSDFSVSRIRVSTIHGAKGLEADNVVLDCDLSPACEETLVNNPDAEHRVFYVGVTRAKKNLYILLSNNQRYNL